MRYHKAQRLNLNNNIVVKVSSGSSHTLALTKEGNLYGWGSNYLGQLGMKRNKDTLLGVKSGRWKFLFNSSFN